MNAKNPKGFRPHTFASLVKKPVHFFAFGLGSGLIHPAQPTASGTYFPIGDCVLLQTTGDGPQ